MPSGPKTNQSKKPSILKKLVKQWVVRVVSKVLDSSTKQRGNLDARSMANPVSHPGACQERSEDLLRVAQKRELKQKNKHNQTHLMFVCFCRFPARVGAETVSNGLASNNI
jgi:hypothetical protein